MARDEGLFILDWRQFTLGTRGFSRVRREFSVLAEGRHIFGRRPKPRVATEKSLAPRGAPILPTQKRVGALGKIRVAPKDPWG